MSSLDSQSIKNTKNSLGLVRELKAVPSMYEHPSIEVNKTKYQMNE